MKMGKTATYTVPSRVAQDLRALSLMLGGDNLSIAPAFGHVSAVTEVAIPASSLSNKLE